ncbi:unnamed protein product [Ostreobium quekettii]|uniref:AB hydrolase-1 domain-containing protein n=1 Tax=Ostreobium quekettii TaxID=121088 RepID=A0A8S1IZK8_9CHLO|nr:unnamed protein product [Ostreobium quekettii]
MRAPRLADRLRAALLRAAFPDLERALSRGAAGRLRPRGGHPRRVPAAMADNERSKKRHRVSSPDLNDRRPRSGHTYKVPGYGNSPYVVSEYEFEVPLDYSGHVPGRIKIFAREVVAQNKMCQQLPYLLYLQGGPGFAATLPIDGGAWLRTAANSFRVVLLDQRGTGRSDPVTCRNLTKKGTPKQQADYLKFFRADSIVRDAEYVREALVPRDGSSKGKWSILGQSFGGFCAVHYLSAAPQGLAEVMITAGIPPRIEEDNPADETYEALFERVIKQNKTFYERFPQDVKAVQDIVLHLSKQPKGGVKLPGGSFLTPRSFQLLGVGLGFLGGLERMHYLIESAFDGGELSLKFLKGFEGWMSWETNPLYALLHEPIYSQGPGAAWAAHRIRKEKYDSMFDAVKCASKGDPVYFTGEMVFPWMFDDFVELRPLKETADLVAKHNSWSRLYDIDTLRCNKVPVAAVAYFEDMYVDFNLAKKSADHIEGLRLWVTSDYLHSGIRDDGTKIFERLMGMVRDNILLT